MVGNQSILTSKLLFCTICMDNFDQEECRPKLASCFQHTFCKKCLDEILKKSNPTCPMCRTELNAAFPAPDNKTVLDLLLLTEEKSTNDEQQLMCGQCARKDAVDNCKTCDNKICGKCAPMHRIRHELNTLTEDVKDIMSQNKEDQPSNASHEEELIKQVREEGQNLRDWISEKEDDIINRVKEYMRAERLEIESSVKKQMDDYVTQVDKTLTSTDQGTLLHVMAEGRICKEKVKALIDLTAASEVSYNTGTDKETIKLGSVVRNAQPE